MLWFKFYAFFPAGAARCPFRPKPPRNGEIRKKLEITNHVKRKIMIFLYVAVLINIRDLIYLYNALKWYQINYWLSYNFTDSLMKHINIIMHNIMISYIFFRPLVTASLPQYLYKCSYIDHNCSQIISNNLLIVLWFHR